MSCHQQISPEIHLNLHCEKNVWMRVFSGPCFPPFGLNTDNDSVKQTRKEFEFKLILAVLKQILLINRLQSSISTLNLPLNTFKESFITSVSCVFFQYKIINNVFSLKKTFYDFRIT